MGSARSQRTSSKSDVQGDRKAYGSEATHGFSLHAARRLEVAMARSSVTRRIRLNLMLDDTGQRVIWRGEYKDGQ